MLTVWLGNAYISNNFRSNLLLELFFRVIHFEEFEVFIIAHFYILIRHGCNNAHHGQRKEEKRTHTKFNK
jgi:hypothetical protein